MMNITEIKKAFETQGVVIEEKILMKNGVQKKALVLGEGSIRPTIYPEDLNIDEDNINEFIYQVLNKKEEFNININKISNWDYVKDHLFPVVLPNINGYEDCVSADLLDLKVIFRVDVSEEDNSDEIQTYLLKQSHLETMNKKKVDVIRAAKKLKGGFPNKIKNMMEILLGDFGMSNEELGFEESPMYVITNKQKMYGAGGMFRPNVLKNAAKRIGTDKLVIIPSSIHELIVIDGNQFDNKEELAGMIGDVNEECVKSYEYLSNHPYVWTEADGLQIM